MRGDLMSVRQRLSGGTTQTDGQARNFVKGALTGVLRSAP